MKALEISSFTVFLCVIEIAHALPGVKISHTVVDEISPTEEESEDANSSCHPVKKLFD